MDARIWMSVLGISAGACLGALSRWQLGVWLNASHPLMPLGTLMANLVGGFLIGFLAGYFRANPHIDPLWTLILITGFLGALTTFSSFSIEVVNMLLADRWGQALATAGAHLLGSLSLTWLGLKLAQMVFNAES
jgi:CrcB protein